MAQGIVLDKSNILEVKVEDGYYHVYYGLHKFACFCTDDAAAKRVIVVQLVDMGVEKTRIALAFSVDRSSIYLWKERYDREGIEGVVSAAKGRPPKITAAIKDYVWALYKKLHTEVGYKNKIIEEVKALYEVEISREGIRRVVNERKESEGPQELVEKKEPVTGRKPIWIKHGGALLALSLLAKYGIEKLLFEGVKRREGRYGFKECVLSLLLLLGPRLVKVEENIKLYDDEIMGGLIGCKRLPSVKTVRLGDSRWVWADRRECGTDEKGVCR